MFISFNYAWLEARGSICGIIPESFPEGRKYIVIPGGEIQVSQLSRNGIVNNRTTATDGRGLVIQNKRGSLRHPV
jgi:hypothetical protein